MRLEICCATMQSNTAKFPGELGSWAGFSSGRRIDTRVVFNTPEKNLGIVGSYQKMYEESEAEILCYYHDDLFCYEQDWDVRVLKEFEDPDVGIVGFGGARAHGSPDLFKVPYRLNDLARFGYMSNVDDAEVHGERFNGAADVAVLDGYALCVRRSFLDGVGGWSSIIGNADFFNYDYAICALARRSGLRIRVLGISCHHYGGRTSVGDTVKKVTSQDAYDKAHRWFYEEFRDVMPFAVKP